MSAECNESEVNSIKQFLNSYDCGKSVDNCMEKSKESPTQENDGFNTTDSIQASVVMRNKSTTDSCVFSDHTISPNDVEPELFDWLFYQLQYKKCPYSLAIALSVIVSRKLGLGETALHESQTDSRTDNSKPALSSSELYSQSLEYLTEYINHWKENPEIAVEIAKEYSGKTFLSSIYAVKNTRRKMEDRHVVLHDLNKALNLKLSKQYSYYAIFDGHAGVDAASYSAAHLHHNLVKSQAFLDGDINGAFKEAFSLTDLHYLERSAREGKKSGSTALCALLEGKSKLFIAWLGDSQAILVKNGKPIDIMIPHKPELEEERKRIEELGGFVAYVDTWRVNGTLAVSRAIGDPEHKPFISSEPDIKEIDLDSDDDFVILACDGLWDQLTPEEATTLVYQYICESETENTQEIGEKVASYLSNIAKEEGSSDNITTIVLFFKDISQLMATKFTPLTPRDRSLTSEIPQNGQLSSIDSSHFQFSDSQYEYMQSTGNPFDSSSANSMNWNTPSPVDDIMNNAKLNIEVSESIISENTNDSNEMSNPFNDFTEQLHDNSLIVGISNENIVECNADMQSSELSTELLSGEQQNINPFQTNTDKQTNYSYDSYSQSLSLTNNSIVNALQTDTHLIGSNISDFSTSFPLSQTKQLDPELCSTSLQSSLELIVDSLNSIVPENTVSETIMDFSSDQNEELCSFRQNSSDANIVGLQNVEKRDEINFVSNEINSELESNERNESTNESFGNSFIEENNSLERTSWFTANNDSIENDQTKINNEVEYHFNDDINNVLGNQEQKTVIFNLNQDFQDFSSGNESVDSIVYEKVNLDSNSLTKTEEINEDLMTTENVMIEEEKNTFTLETVEQKPEDYLQSLSIESNFVDNVLESLDSKPEQFLGVENEISKPEVNLSEIIESNLDEDISIEKETNFVNIESDIVEPKLEEDLPVVSEDFLFNTSNELSETPNELSETPNELSETPNELSEIPNELSETPNELSETPIIKTEQNLLPENIESISTHDLESNVSEASLSAIIGTDSVDYSLESKEAEYIAFENTDSKVGEDLSKSVNSNTEELLLLENIEQISGENYSVSEESKPNESLSSDLIESKPPVIESEILEFKPEDSLHLNDSESKPSNNFSEALDSHNNKSLIVETVESKVRDKSPNLSTITPKTTKAVPSKTLNKSSSLSTKTTNTTATKKPIADNKAKTLSEKLAPKPTTGTVRPKTTPISTSNGTSRPTVKTSTSTAAALKPSSAPKPSRPSESRVSATRLTSTSALTKSSVPRTQAATKVSESKVSSAKTLASKPSTVSRTTAGRALSATRTTITSSATTAKPSTSTTASSLSRRTVTQSTTSSGNTRPKTSTITGVNKTNGLNEKPSTARSQTSTLKSVTSRIDTGRALSASNKPTVNTKVVAKSSTLQSKTGTKPISVKGENKVFPVSKPTPTATTSNGFSSAVSKHNNPLKVAKPLKQELEDADLLSQPMISSIETKRSDISSPNDSVFTFSSPDTAEKAFLMSKTESFNLSSSPNTNGFNASQIDNNE